MSKIIFIFKCCLVLLIAFSMLGYIYFISSFDDWISHSYYRAPLWYNILVTIIAIGLITYIIFLVRKVSYKIVLLFITLMLFSCSTVSIDGSVERGYQNFVYPFISLKHIQTDYNSDFELSDCNVNYFFYHVRNKYNKGILFRGFTSIAIHLCDTNIDSPSYSKDAQ